MLVTGASSGLGAALAVRLAELGADPILVGRDPDRLGAVAGEVRARGARPEILVADLASPDAVERMAPTRAPDALVLAAGVHAYGRSEDLSAADRRRVLQVNALAPIALLDRFVDDRRAALVVTSIGAILSAPFQAWYAGSKAMLHHYAWNLRLERDRRAAPGAITICAPGAMWTPMIEGSPVGRLLTGSRVLRASLLPTERVAAEALAAWERGRPLVIPGRINRALVRAWRLAPQRALGAGAAWLYDAG